MAEDRHSAEEKGEYDYEGDMAKSQLKSIITNAQRMHDMLEETTNLPEWVQSKITLAEDYILTATSYMEGEMSEEYSIQERINMAKAKMGDVIKDFYKSDAPQFAGRSKSKRRQMAIAAKLGAMRKSRMSEELKGNQHKIDANKNNKIDAHDFKLLRSKMKMKKEEVEQVGEAFVLHKGKSAPGSTSTISGTHHGVTVKPVYTNKKEAQAHADKINAGRGYKPGDEKSSLYRGVLYQVSPARQMKKEEVESVAEGSLSGLEVYMDPKDGKVKKYPAKPTSYNTPSKDNNHNQPRGTSDVKNRLKIGLMKKEEVDQIGEAPYMGKGNHKPGWMLRADPELARKFKEIEDRKKRMNSMMKKYGGKTGDEIAKMAKEEASPMIKPPSNRFDNKKDAFAHAKKHGGKVYRHEYINPRSGLKSTTFSVKEEVEQVNELKKSTLGSYIKKASSSAVINTRTAAAARNTKPVVYSSSTGDFEHRPDPQPYEKKASKRLAGISKAVNKMAKEEVEQVDEVIGNTTGYSDSGPRNKADERKFHQMRNVVTKGPRKGKITKYAQNRLKARLMDKTYMEEVEIDEGVVKATNKFKKRLYQAAQSATKVTPQGNAAWTRAAAIRMTRDKMKNK